MASKPAVKSSFSQWLVTSIAHPPLHAGPARARGCVHPSPQVLEQLHTEGRARAIGVSNFEAPHLRQLLAAARVRPAVNLLEVSWRPAAGRPGAERLALL